MFAMWFSIAASAAACAWLHFSGEKRMKAAFAYAAAAK
jgi:hypothetical protein